MDKRLKSSSSSSESSRKRPLEVGAGTGGTAKKNATSSSSDRLDLGKDNSKIPTYVDRFTKDFVINGQLGKGGYGKVYECQHKLDKSTYAVKLIPFKDEEYERCLREPRILAAAEHPGIVRYNQCWIQDGTPDSGSGSSEATEETDASKETEATEETGAATETDSGSGSETEATKTLYVVMELCDRRLHDVLMDDEKVLEENDAWCYFQQILEALKCIHESGTVHGDISRDNIFITKTNRVKIGDFGLARECGDETSILLGNLMYQAPELLLDPKSISDKSDMFALGLVAFEMFYRMKTESERVLQFEELKKNNKVTGVMEETVRVIVDALLNKDPMERPSAADLLRTYFPQA